MIEHYKNTKRQHDKYHDYLFFGEGNLTASEKMKADRYKEIFVVWLDKPYLRTTDMIKYIVNNHFVTPSQAYKDLTFVQSMLGDIQNAKKEWVRYQVNEMILRSYKVIDDAKSILYDEDGQKKQGIDSFTLKLAQWEIDRGKAMINAAEALGRANNIDKEEIERPNWDEFFPSNFIPSSDPKLVGWDEEKRPIQEVMTEVRKKYNMLEIEAIDVKIEE